MLKKIRKQFIRSAVLAFSIVMLVLACTINIVNYVLVTHRLDFDLSYVQVFESKIADMDILPETPAFDFPNAYDPEMNYTTRYFAVHFDAGGNVTGIHTDFISAVEEEDAELYAEEILQKSADHGFYKNYRYLKIKTSEASDTAVIFLNAATELHAMHVLLITSLAVLAASILAVLGLSVFLSKKAIKPYADNLKMQKQFITDASHELKTPLTSIATSTDVLAMELGPNEWVENIRKQTGHLSGLIKNLVTLSRLDEDLPIPEKTQVCLSDLAWEALEGFESRAKAENKTLKAKIEEDLTVLGAENYILQLFSILLDNAVKYSPADTTIEFQVFAQHNKKYILVENTIDGPAIEDPNRLFDRFYRPDSSRTSSTGGHGIGLSMARAIVLAHNGKITVEEQGQRITFQVIFS